MIFRSVAVLCIIEIFILGELRWHIHDFPSIHRLYLRRRFTCLKKDARNAIKIPQNVSEQYFDQLKRAWDV